jgi:hypothetical protein
MNRIVLGVLIALMYVSANIVIAQDDDFANFKKSYNEGIERENEKFNDFLLKQDSVFASYLRTEWEQFNLFAEFESEKLPGPENIPVYERVEGDNDVLKINTVEIDKIIPQEFNYSTIPIAIPESEPLKHDKDFRFLQMEFYGITIGIDYSRKIIPNKHYFGNSTDIAEFWEAISKTEYKGLLEQLLTVKTNYNLNDWAYYNLVKTFSESTISNKNNSNLFIWFLLTKSGYKIKIAYSEDNLVLLIPFVQQVYGMKYYVFDNLPYYVVSGNYKQIYTYDKEYPGASRIMNLDIYQAPRLGNDIQNRNIAFMWEGDTVSFNLKYSSNLIEFYNNYPQCDIRIYFNSGISQILWQSLGEALHKFIYNKSEEEAASFILKMVQTGFKYKTDREQFGAERFFFPEEIFHYEYSDCEDRSVIFAYLINEFLNIPVIGLSYPGHIATAIKFSEYLNGDVVDYNKQQYVICDPTYVNAPVGTAMPEFKKHRVKILELKNIHLHQAQPDYVWEQVYKGGGILSLGKYDNIYLPDSSVVFAGLFIDSLKICNHTENYPGYRGAFVCEIDKNGDYNWFFPVFADSMIKISTISTDRDGNYYVAGIFNKSLSVEINQIVGMTAFSKENNPAGFVLKINKSGIPLWLKEIDIPDRDLYANSYYQCLLSSDGEITGFTQISESAYDNSTVLFAEIDNQVIFTFMVEGSNLYFENNPIYDSDDKYLLLEVWQTRMQQYLDKHYKDEIAGLFALLETFTYGDVDLSGTELLDALNVVVPNFKVNNEEVYSMLKHVRLIQSRMGVISIYTLNGTNLKFGKIYITNGAMIKFRDYKSGNKQVKVICGIYYNTLFRSIDVNYLKIFKVNGDLLVDYDSRHIQRVYNLKNDFGK